MLECMASNCKALSASIQTLSLNRSGQYLLDIIDSMYKTVWAVTVRVCRQYLLDCIDNTYNTVWPVTVRLYRQYLLSCMGTTYKNLCAVLTVLIELHFYTVPVSHFEQHL